MVNQQVFTKEAGRPTFFEVTWSSSQEYSSQLQRVHSQLGCSRIDPGGNNNNNKTAEAAHTNPHVPKEKIQKNCSLYIQQDMEYRKLMKFTPEQNKRLFGTVPQKVNVNNECIDSREEIISTILSYDDSISSSSTSSSGSDTILGNWIIMATSRPSRL
jgi:hypothetical protein